MNDNRLGEELRRLLDGGALEARAESLLARLEKAPNSVALLRQLADTCRQRGDLAAAAAAYEKLRSLRPLDPAIQRLAATCSGRRPPKAQPTPSAFVIKPDYLPAELLNELREHVDANQHLFGATDVRRDDGKQQLDLSERKSASLADIGDAGQRICSIIDSRFAEYAEKMGAEAFPHAMLSCKISTYGDGHFFRLHQDKATGVAASRRFGFIYYFDFAPTRFTGGELLLYDRDPDTLYPAPSFTNVSPTCNTLVIIPANCWHEVLPVQAPDGDFHAGRFTLSGWFHDKRLLELHD